MRKSACCGCGEFDDIISAPRHRNIKKVKFNKHQKKLIEKAFVNKMERHFNRINKEFLDSYAPID